MSNYPEGPLHFEGSLNFQSLVCELFNNDVGDNPVQFVELNHVSEAFRIQVKFNSKICKDSYAFPLGIERAECTHVMQPVRQFHNDDADIVHH